jgi:surface polysaccharide O-acyltransferase-like enzyme
VENRIKKKTRKIKRFFIPYMAAFLIYGLIGGIMPFCFERGLLNLTGVQWFHLHSWYLCRYAGGYFCAILAKRFCKRHDKKIAGIFAVYICDLPIYVLCALGAGVNAGQAALGLLFQMFNNAVCGSRYISILRKTCRWYVSFKIWMRRYFASRHCAKQLGQVEQTEQIEPAE